jgi:hypothetical protein
MKQLNDLIHVLEKHFTLFEKTDESISKSSVGWHINHSLIVISKIIFALSQSKPDTYKWRFNVVRMLVLGMNKIPRGKGKAPNGVLPKGEITIDSLNMQLQKTKESVGQLDKLQPKNYFNHPYLGDLNLHTTKLFLVIHTNHHFKIVQDIIHKKQPLQN